RRRGGGGMSTASLPPTPASQVRTVLQALQSVLDLAADAETVTLPTTYFRTWRAQLQGVLDQLDTAAPLTEDGPRVELAPAPGGHYCGPAPGTVPALTLTTDRGAPRSPAPRAPSALAAVHRPGVSDIRPVGTARLSRGF